MSNTEKGLFWLCVILTMAMAFTAMMISLPRNVDIQNPTRLDYQGTIVAVFAVLVTILIGWQIYSALNIEKRVRRNEGRVNVAHNHINVERERISRVARISQNYNDGNYLTILSLVQYYEVIRRGESLDANEAALHLRNCYMVSARAMTLYLDVFEESSDTIEEIRQVLESCVQVFRLSSEQLFKSRYLPHIGKIFEPQDHITCDEYYSNIMRHFNMFSETHIDIINQYRGRRRALAYAPSH